MMKIQCGQNELVEKLGVIAGIVPSQTSRPILYDFLLYTRDGSLYAEANDLEVAGKVRIDRVEVLEDGKVSLPAAKFLSILRELPDGTGILKLEEASESRGARLTTEGYEFKLVGDDPEEFPGVTEIDAGKSFEISSQIFAQSLRRVAIATSRDPTRYQLSGVFFEIVPGKLTLTATDGKRLTNDFLKISGSEGTEMEAIVPSRAVDGMLKMLGLSPERGGAEQFTLGFTDTDVVVRTDTIQINAKLVEGTYPNYRSALPKNASIKIRLKRSDLLSAARSAQLMVDDQTSSVVFRFDAENLEISSQAKNIGETRIRVKAEVENGPLEIRFNPTYFIDAIRCIEDEELRIEFEAPERPGIFRGGTNYRHMVMPLVVGES